MFWLKWNPFYFNALLIMLAIAGLTGFIWLKRWRKTIRYRNLFHKLVNQPDLARAAGVKMIGVTWGLLNREQMAALGPDGMLDAMAELVDVVRIDE